MQDRRPLKQQAHDAYLERLTWLGLSFVMLSPLAGWLLGKLF